jgi:hypothetical protein
MLIKRKMKNTTQSQRKIVERCIMDTANVQVHDRSLDIMIEIICYFAEDTVYIKAHTDDFLYGQPDEIYTSFTGFLLVPDEGRTLHGTKGHGR